MGRHKRRNQANQYRYEVLITDWYVNVSFNEYAYINLFDSGEFEERIYMVLEGRITSSMSNKCKKDMAVSIILHPSDVWYNKQRLRDDIHAIGDMEILKAKSYSFKEDTIYFRVGVPTKSYENIREHMASKSKAVVTLVGTDIKWRRGDIYYLGFGKESDK